MTCTVCIYKCYYIHTRALFLYLRTSALTRSMCRFRFLIGILTHLHLVITRRVVRFFIISFFFLFSSLFLFLHLSAIAGSLYFFIFVICLCLCEPMLGLQVFFCLVLFSIDCEIDTNHLILHSNTDRHFPFTISDSFLSLLHFFVDCLNSYAKRNNVFVRNATNFLSHHIHLIGCCLRCNKHPNKFLCMQNFILFALSRSLVQLCEKKNQKFVRSGKVVAVVILL